MNIGDRPVPVTTARKVGIRFAPERVEPFRDSAAAVLLDTLVTGKSGGTGKVFDWQEIAALSGGALRMFAGGLPGSDRPA